MIVYCTFVSYPISTCPIFNKYVVSSNLFGCCTIKDMQHLAIQCVPDVHMINWKEVPGNLVILYKTDSISLHTLWCIQHPYGRLETGEVTCTGI